VWWRRRRPSWGGVRRRGFWVRLVGEEWGKGTERSIGGESRRVGVRIGGWWLGVPAAAVEVSEEAKPAWVWLVPATRGSRQ
jgi:hypothetical protein